MEKEYLEQLKKKINDMSPEEKKARDKEYLMPLAKGELYGPLTGYSSIDKQWYKNYDYDDLNYEIPECSIYRYMIDNCKKYSLRNQMEFGSGKEILKISYLHVFKMIDKVAKSLKQYGVKKGDIVSVCMPNTPEVTYIFYAINKIGAVANMLDPRTNPSNLQLSINDSNSKILLSLDKFCQMFNQIKEDTKLESIIGISPIASVPKLFRKKLISKKPDLDIKLPDSKIFRSWNTFIKDGKKYNGKTEEKMSSEDDAVIAYTGGTTGLSKGVITSNKNLNAMIVENSKMKFNVNPGDRCLNIAPPWTYYGLSNCLNAFTHLGAVSIMIPEIGPNDLGKLIFEYKPNHIITVPSALIAVIREDKLQNMDLSFIKTIIVGADKLEEHFEKEFNEWLAKHNSKCKITKGYGMTEVTAATSYTRDDINEPGNVGIPFIAENISIFNPETGEELKTGETGELAVSGPKNMKKYYGLNSSKTSEVLKKHSDGSEWAHTYDLGHIDENGLVFVDGRLKRMFTKNGFKIFAPEIEKHIYEHPAVQQCAVIPVPNSEYGNVTKVFIVLKPQYKSYEKECQNQIMKLLQSKVFDYELPDLFEFKDELPLTGMNKINFTVLEKEEQEKIESKGKER